MPSHKHLTREIDRAPSDPKIAAFFDVDRTLLAGFSGAAFLRDKISEEGLSMQVTWRRVGRAKALCPPRRSRR